MFTKKEQQILLSFIKSAKNPDKAMTLDALKGLLFGLAVTPDMIMPSEWIPVALGGSAPKVDDMIQARELRDGVLRISDRLSKLQLQGKLQYPFQDAEISEKKVDEIQQWALGLYSALYLRPDIWLKDEAGPFRTKEQDRVVNACGVVSAVALPERASEIFPKQAKALEDDPRRHEKMLTVLLMLLPASVEVIQTCGRHKEQERIKSRTGRMPNWADKIGRNDPCACGSGKKYKKCCGK